MVEGEQGKLHVLENMGGITSNFFDLTTSNIANSNSNVENIVIGNVVVNNVAIIEVV
jgi:hypothetical protein